MNNKLKMISSCQDLFKFLVGKREGLFYYNSSFRQDFELMCYKSSRYDNLLEENKQLKEIIDKAKSLNYEISHTIYENFLEENIVGSKFLYEKVKKQLAILEDKEVQE